MNPNWTGRSARSLSECRFTDDADPFVRSKEPGYPAAWWIAVAIIAMVTIPLAVAHGVAL